MSNTNTNAVTITGNGTIVAFINGKNYTALPEHPNYHKLLNNARAYQFDEFVKNYDLVQNVSMYVSGDVQIVDGSIQYKGHVIHNSLTKKIISFMRNDLPFLPLLKFLENLLQNPSYRAINELYDFLEAGELPVTTDGCFLAYKNVKADYTDIYTGKYNNSVGSVCEMPRNLVDEDKNRTCSYGLHFCSIKYLPHFSDSNGGHTMIVKINPADVVAIPADYNNTKGRTCRYEVIGEYTDDWRSKLDRGESGWDADLYDENGDEYDDDEDDTDCDDTDCDENHCFCDQQDEHGDQVCKQDEAQVGNEGKDHLEAGCCEGSCGCEDDQKVEDLLKRIKNLLTGMGS